MLYTAVSTMTIILQLSRAGLVISARSALPNALRPIYLTYIIFHPRCSGSTLETALHGVFSDVRDTSRIPRIHSKRFPFLSYSQDDRNAGRVSDVVQVAEKFREGRLSQLARARAAGGFEQPARKRFRGGRGKHDRACDAAQRFYLRRQRR